LTTRLQSSRQLRAALKFAASAVDALRESQRTPLIRQSSLQNSHFVTDLLMFFKELVLSPAILLRPHLTQNQSTSQWAIQLRRSSMIPFLSISSSLSNGDCHWPPWLIPVKFSRPQTNERPLHLVLKTRRNRTPPTRTTIAMPKTRNERNFCFKFRLSWRK